MRLGDFITANMNSILTEWEAFARSLSSGRKLGRLALRNDAKLILRASVADMRTAQSLVQQASKSKGHGGAGGPESDALDDIATVHGTARAGHGFNLRQVVAEFRALRSSVLSLWRASNPTPDPDELDDVRRFNESMDQSLDKAVTAYTTRVDHTRRMFLAILAHDLRNPLNTISLSAQSVALDDSIDPDSQDALSQIVSSVRGMSRMIGDLADFASTGLGTAMPLTKAPVNLAVLCNEVLHEVQAGNPARQIIYESQSGDMTLVADAARMRQVISNLLGNAMHHGSPENPVTLSLTDEGGSLVISVHNHGEPIPSELLPTLFDPLVRGEISRQQGREGSIGLGLYIVREIVTAHGGSVEVDSSASAGTLFCVRIPHPSLNCNDG